MHCKICLKKSQYFSSCMHSYCEKCFTEQQYCNNCKYGIMNDNNDNKSNNNILNCLNLDRIKNMFKNIEFKNIEFLKT
jgi:hypothetical protein